MDYDLPPGLRVEFDDVDQDGTALVRMIDRVGLEDVERARINVVVDDFTSARDAADYAVERLTNKLKEDGHWKRQERNWDKMFGNRTIQGQG